MDNEMLTRIFRTSGNKHGFKNVEARFEGFKDFRIKWSRTERWASFAVSDYIKDAPEEIVEGIAETLMSKIRGENRTYPEDVKDWMGSKEFIKLNRGTYLSRCRKSSECSAGEERDIECAYDRLVERGLVERDPWIVMRWEKTLGKRAANSSVLMKTILVNDKLDTKKISDEAFDYMLYTQIAHLNLGFDPGKSRDDEYEVLLSMFDRKALAEQELAGLNVSL